jgi:hypothetical protein
MMTPQSQAPAEPDADADDATVIQLSRREPEQFTVLFRRHAPHIQRYVIRRLGSDAADDIVAETFLLAFRQRDRYDPARADARGCTASPPTSLAATGGPKSGCTARWPGRGPIRSVSRSRTGSTIGSAPVRPAS